jgi:F-type H+-transporting ATPase subunit gamma
MSGQLKEVRNRIKSVTSTQQITKAMKMVSAAKLRHHSDAPLLSEAAGNAQQHR